MDERDQGASKGSRDQAGGRSGRWLKGWSDGELDGAGKQKRLVAGRYRCRNRAGTCASKARKGARRSSDWMHQLMYALVRNRKNLMDSASWLLHCLLDAARNTNESGKKIGEILEEKVRDL
jgi:hypothetical protein